MNYLKVTQKSDDKVIYVNVNCIFQVYRHGGVTKLVIDDCSKVRNWFERLFNINTYISTVIEVVEPLEEIMEKLNG